MLSQLSKGIQKGALRATQKGVVAGTSNIRCFNTKIDQGDQIKTLDDQENQVVPTESYLQFSRAPTMANFGDLPRGEIPEPLKYNRPMQSTTLGNGIRVVTEKSGSQTASVGVYIGAGSRQDTLETTGAANMLTKMLLRGTSATSKAALAEEVESMGGRISSDVDREMTNLNMTCFKGDLSRAVALLGDAITNATLDHAELEIAKQEQTQAHEVSSKNYFNTTIEAVHFNTFRDHMMGQPIKGDADNVQNLTADILNAYRSANYTGENIVVVGTGGVDHDAFVEQVNAAFGSLNKTQDQEVANSDKCVYVPALLMMRDDEMYNANVGVFYDAPSVNHEDYYSFQLLRHMIGDYDIQKNAEHLNDTQKQYNATQSVLGELPDVTLQKCKYYAYSDCAIWGSYIFGNEIFVRQMNWIGIAAPTFYGDFVNEVEVVRGRNAFWNELMSEKSTCESNQEIGKQMIQTGRRVTRSEIAKRISHLDANYVKNLCYNWFYDAEPSFTNWGPIQDTASFGSYKYFKINTMCTVSSVHQSLWT